jgi:hypothetical protein
MFGPLIVVFLATAHGIYQEFYSQDLTCSGAQPSVRFVPNRACSTEAVAGITLGVCVNAFNLSGSITTCPETVVLPPHWASLQGWAGNALCAGLPDYTIAMPANTCSGYWDGPTMELDCAVHAVRECAEDEATCQGCPSRAANARGTCAAGNPTLNLPMASYIFTCPPCGREGHQHHKK